MWLPRSWSFSASNTVLRDFALDIIKKVAPNVTFVRNVVSLATSTIVSHGVVVIASPLLARLYGPADFGTLAAVVSIVSLGSIVSAWRYEVAIPLPRDAVTGGNLLILAIGIVTGMSCLCGLVTWLLGGAAIGWAGTPYLKPYLWLIPVGFLVAGLHQTLTMWAVRNNAFGTIARGKITQAWSAVGTQLPVGLAHAGPLGLLLGDVLGRGCGAGVLGTLVVGKNSTAVKNVTLRGIVSAAATYRRFPLLSSGSALLNNAGLQLPPLLLAAFYGPQVAGWFSMTLRILAMPVVLLGESIGRVFWGESARTLRENPKDLERLFKKTAGMLLLLAAVPVVLVSLLAPSVFTMVLGEPWREAGVYAQLLAVMFAAGVVASPLSVTLFVLERQDLQLAWDTARFISVVGAFFIVHSLGLSARTAVFTYSVIMAVTYIAHFFLAWLCIRANLSQKQLLPESPAST